MYENVKGISIKGKCFENQTMLNFFEENTQRISLIFGRNGSGKSTISNGLYKYATNDTNTETQCKLVDFNNDIIVTKSTDNNYGAKERIFVFNEHYINKNIGLKDDGLDTIVLFGNQNSHEDEIITNKQILEKLYAKSQELEDSFNKCNTKKNNKFKEIKKILQQSNG